MLKSNIKLWEHQQTALELSRTMRELGLFFDMGTGKTLTSIAILAERIERSGRIPRTLILGPLSVVENWKREIEKYTEIESTFVLVPKGTGTQKNNYLVTNLTDASGYMAEGKIVSINYETLLNNQILATLQKWGPEFIIFDESHLLKNTAAQRSKRSCKLADDARWKLILTGTPIANTPEDAFMQYRILDGGATFGKSKKVFMSQYFDARAVKYGANQFNTYTIRKDKIDELQSRMYAKALRKKKEECLDLPPYIETAHFCTLNDDQLRAYKQMERDLIAFIEGAHERTAIVAEMAMTKAMKMQQIVTGFAIDDKEEIVDFGNVPRLQELGELLEQLTPEHKVIVWTCFVHNTKKISEMCTKMGIKHARIEGGQNGTERQANIDSFEKDNDCRVIIANRRAGGTGINLIQASYSIVYSKNASLIDDEQSKARNYRGGSEIHEKITKIDMCATGTIDEHITEALSNKVNLAEKILDYKKGLSYK